MFIRVTAILVLTLVFISYLHQMTRTTMPRVTTRTSTTIDPATPATSPRSVKDVEPELLVGTGLGTLDDRGSSAQRHEYR